jgi:hypothetical protein
MLGHLQFAIGDYLLSRMMVKLDQLCGGGGNQLQE